MSNPRAPLPDVSKFFEESWRLFRARVWKLLTIAGLGSLTTFAAAVLPLGAGAAVAAVTGLPGVAIWGFSGLISLSILLWLMSWVQVAMIECATAEDADAAPIACFKRGWPKVAEFSWVCILYMLLVLGGSFELALPGIFLSMALLFAPFICVTEGVGGIAALRRSLDDTRGYFLAVLVRTGLAGAATSVTGMVPGIGWLLSAVTGPFTLAALAVLAKDLRKARPQPDEPSGRGWVLAVAAADLILPVALAVRVIPILIEKAPQFVEAGKRMAENPQDSQMPQKILAILQGEASTTESLSTAVGVAQQLTSSTSTVSVPTPPPAPVPQK